MLSEHDDKREFAAMVEGDAVDPRALYVELLIKILANTIYGDPAMAPWSDKSFKLSDRLVGRDWPLQAHSMAGVARLTNLAELVGRVLRENVPGNLIETGVWRGGCCILMQALLTLHGERARKVFVADSFQGLPKPDPRHRHDRGDTHHRFAELSVGQAEVRRNFERYDMLASNVLFVEGFFEATLPHLETGPLALMRLDGDMYGSTMVALETLYPKLSPGGFVIVDDYGAISACRAAVEAYRTAHGITAPIETIDWTGAWWRKPALAAASGAAA